MVGSMHDVSTLPTLNTASNTGWWKPGPTCGKFPVFRVSTLIHYLQHYKTAKSETDACVERLKRITNEEPVRESGCENLLPIVAESRNKV